MNIVLGNELFYLTLYIFSFGFCREEYSQCKIEGVILLIKQVFHYLRWRILICFCAIHYAFQWKNPLILYSSIFEDESRLWSLLHKIYKKWKNIFIELSCIEYLSHSFSDTFVQMPTFANERAENQTLFYQNASLATSGIRYSECCSSIS